MKSIFAVFVFSGFVLMLNSCGDSPTKGADSAINSVIYSNWVDATTTDGNVESTCDETPENCSLRDKISGKEWTTKHRTYLTFNSAWNYCRGLIYNGKSDWHLPTVEELKEVYANGIMLTAGRINHTNWLTSHDLHDEFWSSTPYPSYTYTAWYVYLGTGRPSYALYDYTTSMNQQMAVICVRP